MTFATTLLYSVPWMATGAMAGINMGRNTRLESLMGASIFGVTCAAQHYSLASEPSAKLGAATAGLVLALGSNYLVEKIHLEQAEANSETISMNELYWRRVSTSVLTALSSYYFGRDLVLTLCLTGLSVKGSYGYYSNHEFSVHPANSITDSPRNSSVPTSRLSRNESCCI